MGLTSLGEVKRASLVARAGPYDLRSCSQMGTPIREFFLWHGVRAQGSILAPDEFGAAHRLCGLVVHNEVPLEH
jgi:hypothetical protein